MLQPRWMWDNRELMENIPLGQVMVPGSHDAGAYKYVCVYRVGWGGGVATSSAI